MSAWVITKALLWAVLILVLKLVLTTLVAVSASAMSGPAPSPELVARWAGPVLGFALFSYLLHGITRRHPERSGAGFALLTWAFFAALYCAHSILLDGATQITPEMPLSIALAFAGAMLGALTGRSRA